MPKNSGEMQQCKLDYTCVRVWIARLGHRVNDLCGLKLNIWTTPIKVNKTLQLES